MTIQVERAHGLEALGIVRAGHVHWNLSPAALYEEAVRRGEGILAAEGPLVAKTGQHTGRSPNDKFVVQEPSSERHVHWGNINRPVEEAKFDALHKDMMAYLQDKELYILDAWGGTAPPEPAVGCGMSLPRRRRVSARLCSRLTPASVSTCAAIPFSSRSSPSSRCSVPT